MERYNILWCSVSSVGRASVLWAEGHGFEPHTEHNVTLQQLIHHYLRFDGHSNYYVLTAIPQNKAFYLLCMNIAIKCLLHKGYIMLNLTSNINGNVQQISLSLFMTGCRFDPCCSTWKRGLVPMENCIVSRTILFDFVLFTLACPSRSKGRHLRCPVFARVGSNPTASNFFYFNFIIIYKTI